MQSKKYLKYSACLALLSLLLAACDDPGKTEAGELKGVPVDSSAADTIAAADPLVSELDCPRGLPEPALDSTAFKDWRFVINKERDGIETATLSNGDKLTIVHTGCEYVILSFRFETTRFNTQAANITGWYKNISGLLLEARKGIKNDPVGLADGHTALVNYIDTRLKTVEELKLHEEIDYGGKDIRSFVLFEKIVEQPGKPMLVEISFNVGPL